MSDTLLLIDLSSIAHPEWHHPSTQKDPNPNATSIKTIARVRALACEHPHAAICCDSGRSFRHELDPTYKANRPEAIAPLQHQIRVAADALVEDGFPVWLVKGYEADDLIATATRLALECDGDVLIASADKDLLQLVGPHVQVKRLTDGAIWDEATVMDKLKVRPDQMVDYLSLVGDTSDNVVGAKGIGAKRAAELLISCQSIEGIFEDLKNEPTAYPPGITNSLTEFRPRWPTVRQLITLKTDAPIPFHEIASERKVKPMSDMHDENMAKLLADEELRDSSVVEHLAVTQTVAGSNPAPSATSLAVIDYERQLEPRSLGEANKLAMSMFQSRLFSAYGTAEGIFSTILAGRELGLPAMASLRAFHIIEGKPQLSAGTIQSLVLKSGKAKTFRCTERTDAHATFTTQRGDDPPMSLSYTIEEGRRAFVGDDAKWQKSGWGRNPADMCVARAATKLARLVYPDVVSGLYAPEEFD